MGKKKILKKSSEIDAKVTSIPEKSNSKPSESEINPENAELDEVELCKLFDKYLSIESGDTDDSGSKQEIFKIEEGIQSVRDMYLDVCVLEKKYNFRLNAWKSKKQLLEEQKIETIDIHDGGVAEVRKIMAQTDKLKALSEELQKSKEKIAIDSEEKSKLERSKRQIMNDEFIEKTKEISARLEENSAQRFRSLDENGRLKSELRVCLENYHKLEEDFERQLIEIDAKLVKASQKYQSEEDLIKKEQSKTEKIQEKIATINANETNQKQQLLDYATKFEEFQVSLNSSNETFSQFKTKMDEMAKNIEQLEAENRLLNENHSLSHRKLELLRAERVARETELEKNKKQSEKLIGLISVLNNDIAKSKREFEFVQGESTVEDTATIQTPLEERLDDGEEDEQK